MAQTLQSQRWVNFQQTSQIGFDTRQKMAIAVELRKQGRTWREIGEAVGCSTPYAERLVRKALRAIIEQPTQELIALELQRLDELLVPAFKAATQMDADGNPIFNKDAIDSVLKIMERRAKYQGLDKPTKTQVRATVTNASVSIYLPDNGRGDSGVVIDNATQRVEDPAVAIIQAASDVDMGEEPMDFSDLPDDPYFEDEEQYLP